MRLSIINEKRKARKFSIQKVATISGVAYSTTYDLLMGKSKKPNIETVTKIAKALDIKLEELL